MTIPGRSARITSRAAFIAAGVFGAAAIIVGFIPYTVSGWGAVCPSAFTALTGGASMGQGLFNAFSGGGCSNYVGQMELLITVGLVLAVVAVVVGILARKKARLGSGYLPQAYAPTAGAPAAPGYAPPAAAAAAAPGYEAGAPGQAAGSEPAAEYPRVLAAPGSNPDVKAALWVVGIIAAIVVSSLLVHALAFLPGFLQLVLWAAVEVTIIWQVLEYTAKGDPLKLAAAERWNPSVLARTGYEKVRESFDDYRLARAQAQAARPVDQAPAPAPPAYAEPVAPAPTQCVEPHQP